MQIGVSVVVVVLLAYGAFLPLHDRHRDDFIAGGMLALLALTGGLSLLGYEVMVGLLLGIVFLAGVTVAIYLGLNKDRWNSWRSSNDESQ